MYKKLRIICAIVSALFLAVIVPAMILFGTNGLIICGFCAGLFFFLTLLFRKAQQKKDEKNGIIPENTNLTDSEKTPDDTSVQPFNKNDENLENNTKN